MGKEKKREEKRKRERERGGRGKRKEERRLEEEEETKHTFFLAFSFSNLFPLLFSSGGIEKGGACAVLRVVLRVCVLACCVCRVACCVLSCCVRVMRVVFACQL